MTCIEQVIETSYAVSEGTEKTNQLGHTPVMWAVLWVTDLVVIESQQTMGYGHV